MSAPYVTLTLHRFDRWMGRAWALGQMGASRLPLMRKDGPSFFKLCGSGSAEGFRPIPNPAVWAILACWRDAAHAEAGLGRAPYTWWRRRADEAATFHMTPSTVRGAWSGRAPFSPADAPEGVPIAVLTRGTVRLRHVPAFWRHTPAVSAEVRRDPDMAFRIGIGEVPWLHQVTFSVWPNLAAMRRFARGPAHAAAIRGVRQGGWFAEELYAHLAVTRVDGTWEGAPPLARLAPSRNHEPEAIPA